jgi:hypothetical protein
VLLPLLPLLLLLLLLLGHRAAFHLTDGGACY